MSYVFDAVLCSGTADVILTYLPSVPKVEIRTLEPNISVLLTVENVRDFSGELVSLASSLSLTFEKTLYIQYADNVGWRYSALFVKGAVTASFGEDEELWVRLNDDGLPDLDEKGEPIGGLIHVQDMDKFGPDEEFETYQNAIQLGLAAFGRGDWSVLKRVILGE